MGESTFPFDLSGATVVEVKWPAKGFTLVLDGKSAGGRVVAGVQVRFEGVTNREALQGFLREKRTLRRRKSRTPQGRERVVTLCDVEPYPLKLPARLTCLQASPDRAATYGDPAFIEAHGELSRVRSGERLYLFALQEKRFKGRDPFPIVCARAVFAGQAPEPDSPRQANPRKAYEALARTFAQAVLTGVLDEALALGTPALRRRLQKADPSTWAGDWPHAAVKVPASHLTIEVNDDPDEVWSTVAEARPPRPRDAVRALVTITYAGRREERTLHIVEEAGELRVGWVE